MALLLLTLALAGGVYWATRPARLAGFVQAILVQQTGSPAQVGHARLHWTGRLTLDQVDLGVLNPAGHRLDLFHAARIELTLDWGALLVGRLEASDIAFIQPRLDLIEDLDHHTYNLQLFQVGRADRKKPSRLPESLPDVAIRQGILRFGEWRDGRYSLLARVPVDGRLSAIAGQQGVYACHLRQRSALAASEAASEESPLPQEAPGQAFPKSDEAGGVTIDGQFNLRTLAVTARVDGLVVEHTYRQMLPHAMRAWWDRLSPGGALPDVQLGYDPAGGVQATLELAGVSLVLPAEPSPMPMTDVTGRFTLMDEQVQVERLRGSVHGVTYEINGRIDGLDPDAPFQLTADIARFHIPDDPAYLMGLPGVVQKQFRRFAPSGTFSAQVQMRRDTPGSDIRYAGSAHVHDAQGLYAKFPYPVEQVQGELRFDEEALQIVSLTGRGVTGARFTLSGRIAPPHDDAAVDIRVTATDIPIDDKLYDALDPEEKEVYDGFFDLPSEARLRELGLIQSAANKAEVDETLRQAQRRLMAMSPDDPARDALARHVEALQRRSAVPVFEMGGFIDVDVHMVRELGPDKPYLPTLRIDASRANIISEPWGYPLRMVGGELLVEPGLATLRDIRVQGLDGVSGVVRGHVSLPRKSVPGSRFSPAITFEGGGLPVSELLLASLPDEQAQWIRRLAITGAIKLDGRVYRDGDKPLDFDIHAHLADGSARPFEGGMALRDVQGQVVIHRRSVEVTRLAGQAAQATLAVRGDIAWAGRDTSLQLRIEGHDMGFDQPVLDLVPEQTPQVQAMRALIDAHQPTGRYDGQVTVAMAPDQPVTYQAVVHPRSLALDHQGRRVTFDTMAGQVTLTPQAVRLQEVTATLGDHGRWGFDGQVDLSPRLAATLKLDGASDQLDATTLALLPAGVRGALDALSLKTGYAMRGATLRWRPGEAQPVRFEGTLDLAGASAQVGVPVTQASGQVTLSVQAQAGDAPPRWKMDLRDFNAQVMGRQVESLHATIQSAEPATRLVIPALTGRLYQGQLTGEGEVLLEEDATRYGLRLTLQDAAADAVIDPAKWSVTLAQAIADGAPFARLSGNLALQGTAGQDATRQGRGRLELRDANLFQTPLTMALLQIVSLTLPTARSFEQAQAMYVIDGQTVRFDTLRLATPSLGLVGQGTMTLPDGRLDLQLVVRNLTGPELGPLGDLLRVLRDGLIAIHVGGTLDRPVAQVKPLSGIGRSWNEVFGTPEASSSSSP